VLHLQAPEVFERNFGTQADMWSLGMLAYQTLSNRCAASQASVPHSAMLPAWLL
jgi:serine/threonine protein kinase